MCKYSLLAQRGPFRVDVCQDCSCIHLHMGPMSFRLDESAAGTLCDVLREALDKRRPTARELEFLDVCRTHGCN